MKKSELKQLIKPIVKECVEESVREIVIESGLLSSVINEVVKGTLPLLVESTKETKEIRMEIPKQKQPLKNNQLMENLKRERDSIAAEYAQQNAAIASSLSMKVGNVDVFKDTKPAPAESADGVANPLSGVDPRDPGVDISRLFGSKKFNTKL